jgi:hydroxypyruvate isomerase
MPFENLKKKVIGTGLPCLACNNFIPKSIHLTGLEYNEDLFKDYIARAVARAASLGARKIVFGSAGARNVPSDFPMEKARIKITERLCFIGDVAEKNNIQIEIEHLNRLESNIINTFSDKS